MIDFKEELKKFKPIIEIEEMEKTIHKDEMQDILDLFQYIKNNKADKE